MRRPTQVALGAAIAAVLIAPVATWFLSRAKQAEIDRQTADRLRR